MSKIPRQKFFSKRKFNKRFNKIISQRKSFVALTSLLGCANQNRSPYPMPDGVKNKRQDKPLFVRGGVRILRNSDGSRSHKIPLFIEHTEWLGFGITQTKADVMRKNSADMIRHNEKRLSEFFEKLKKENIENANKNQIQD